MTFPNFRRSKDYFSFNYVQKSPRIANSQAVFEIGHANVKIGNEIYPLQVLNEKQIGKELTNIGIGSRETFGKIVRRRLKSAIEELNGEIYAAVINVAGVIKIAMTDYHRVDDCHVAGTFFIIHAKEGLNGEDHDYATYKHVMNFDADKEKFYTGKNIKPFTPSLNTKSFTEAVNTMIKVNTHGGARKVKAVITETSTLVENNVATVEIKEVTNQHADVINEQAERIESLEARLKAMEELLKKAGDNTPVISGRYTSAPAANGRYDRNEYLNQAIEDLVVNL
ncbi:hypothetical protein [Aeromonas hydrophila]|uniref:hypothetical protein n=1 Tax=Aeromonas hydrophila TaxID=644 RepID=UPI003EC8B443